MKVKVCLLFHAPHFTAFNIRIELSAKLFCEFRGFLLFLEIQKNVDEKEVLAKISNGCEMANESQ